jgi:hypothetical protein
MINKYGSCQAVSKLRILRIRQRKIKMLATQKMLKTPFWDSLVVPIFPIVADRFTTAADLNRSNHMIHGISDATDLPT